MRPIIRRVVPYDSLKNPSMDLADFARMNDALDVQDENAELARKAKD